MHTERGARNKFHSVESDKFQNFQRKPAEDPGEPMAWPQSEAWQARDPEELLFQLKSTGRRKKYLTIQIK